MTGAHDLFELDPKEFVAARDQLARELKAAGDKDGAAAVKALKRPTVAMWALNQVARREPEAVDALVTAAADARATQEAVLGGGKPDHLRDALTRRRDAAATVTRHARTVLRESGRSPESYERDIEEAIDATTATNEGADLLNRGELSTIPQATASDDDTMFAALLASSDPDRAPRAKQAEPEPEPEPPQPSAYFVPERGALRPVPQARSPWADDMLHGRLLAGLAARAAESECDDNAFAVTRITLDMFRFPPMTPFKVSSKVARAGGRVRVVDVSIAAAGKEVARAHVLSLKTSTHPELTAWRPQAWDAPHPDDVPSDPEFVPDNGWEIRLMSEGGFWSSERKRLWTHDGWALVEGEPLSPVVRAALAADLPNPMANSGSEGLPFINADLTLFLARAPRSEWIGLEVADHVAADGVAIGMCTLYDTDGPIGSSTVCAVTNAATLSE